VSRSSGNPLKDGLDRLLPDERALLMLRFATSRSGAPEQAARVHVSRLANPPIGTEVPAEYHNYLVNQACAPPSKDQNVALADALGPLGVCILSGFWILALVAAIPVWWFKKTKGLLTGKSHGEK
jgi:hypothetical protein